MTEYPNRAPPRKYAVGWLTARFGAEAAPAPPLNVAGGHQFPGTPHVAHVIPRSRAARTLTVAAKADSDGLDIPASRVRRPAP